MAFTPDVPDVVLYGVVGGNFVRFLADGPDAGQIPDQKTLSGAVTLVPGVRIATWPTTDPTRMSVIENIECPIIAGVLYPPGTIPNEDGSAPEGAVPDVWLVASHQPAAMPSYIPWTATFRLNGVATQPPPVKFNVVPNERIDLVLVVPAAPEPSVVTVVSHADLVEVRAIRDEVLGLAALTERGIPWTGTQAEYDALPVKDPQRLYLVV